MRKNSRMKFNEDLVIRFGKDKNGKKTGPDNNPKRSGSRAAADFEKYEEGMTVKEYLEAGGSRASVNWDATHGYIRLEEGDSYGSTEEPEKVEEEEEEEQQDEYLEDEQSGDEEAA